MGTSKINIFLVISLFLTTYTVIFAQAEYVQYDHPVYLFLERMSSFHIVSDFNSLERPLTRNKIADLLQQVNNKKYQLTIVDSDILNDFYYEFEYDILRTTINSQNIFSSEAEYSFPSEKESYIYSLTDSSKASIFVNFIGSTQYLDSKIHETDHHESAGYTRYGGIIRGTFLNKFGFFIKATNGLVSGSRLVARNINEVNFSYKFNEGPSQITASNYVDNTEGYITADFDIIKFKLGRDKKEIGFGPVNYILGSNIPSFDQLSLNLNYKLFSFSYFHGKLLGTETTINDTVQGRIKNITDKYVAYHRMGFNINNHLSFGLGEVILYSDRSIDFSYLNPFNFYKSVEHANQDRDNSMLFLDISNNSIKGLKLFGSILIDDIDFGKLGSNWYGNELLYNFTLYSANLYKYIPIDLYLQYVRVNPYVYTHRIKNNNYTNMDYSLANPLKPNSDMFIFRCNYTPHHKLRFLFDFSFTRHGANEYNPDGSLARNVGGDVLIGHREWDATEVTFLDGNREYYRNLSVSSFYEIINNIFFSGLIRYYNNSLYNEEYKSLLLSLGLDIRL